VDGAALAAVGNFNRSSNAVTNRDDVATIMRNFAVANFTSLGQHQLEHHDVWRNGYHDH